eukprot:gene5996-6445_t
MAFIRSLYPTIFDSAVDPNTQNSPTSSSFGPTGTQVRHHGIKGICWKASRIGERLSPYIAGSCVVMAIHILFIKA